MSILLVFADVTTEVLLPAAVGAISVSVAIMASAALARRLTRSGKVWVGQGAGRTRVSPYVLIGGLVSAAGALFFLVAGLYDSERLREPVQFYCWVALVGASALGALVFLPFAQHTWEWDSTGLHVYGSPKFGRNVPLRHNPVATLPIRLTRGLAFAPGLFNPRLFDPKSEEAQMPKLFIALLCGTLAAVGSAAALPLPAPDTLSIEKAVEPVACVGDRRNYRSFNHCWRVNIKRSTPMVASRYCSRICSR